MIRIPLLTRRGWLLLAGVVLGALLLARTPALAQSPDRARLTGTISTEDGVPLPSANVFLLELDRGTAASLDGTYRVDDLPPRTVTVRFSHVGYRTVTRTVDLEAGGQRRLDVTLSTRTIEGREVTVTGTATATDVLESPQDVDVLGPDEIETTRTASLGKLLEDVPGISNIQTGSQAGKPVLRGLSGNRIRFLQDGVGQEYFQYGVRHFPTTSLMQAHRVEVVRGASSILYGSDALGGAINVHSKPVPSVQPGQSTMGARAETQYLTNNRERAATLEVRGARGGLGMRAGLERRVGDDFTAPDAPTFFETGREGAPKYTGTIPFTNFEQLNGFAKVGYQGSFGSVHAIVDHWENDHNFLLPVGGPKGSPENPPRGVGQHIAHQNAHVGGVISGSGFVVRPRVSYQRSVRQSAEPGTLYEAETAHWPVDLRKDVVTARIEVLHPEWAGLEGTVGTEVRREVTSVRGPEALEPPSTVTGLGLFAFEDWNRRSLTLSAGGRFDVRAQEADPNERTADPALLEQTFAVASGTFGANYRLLPELSVASNVSVGFRAPSMFELYASGVHGGIAAYQEGAPGLSPERSISTDLSLRLRGDRVTGKLTIYRNRILDYVYLRNTEETRGDLPVFRSAQTDALIRGIDAGGRVNATDWLQVGWQMAFITSTGEDIENGRDAALPLLPADRVETFVRVHGESLGRLEGPHVRLDLIHTFEKDAAGRYEPFAQFDFGPPFGTASTDPYTLVDVEAGATVRIHTVPVDVHATVENLFDAVYRDFLDTYKGYALSAGRNFGVKISVPLNWTE